MSSEWMKVMLEEIARKKAEAEQQRAEAERPPCRAEGASPRTRSRMIPLKDDTPSALKPYVTVSLIVACCGVFLWQRSLNAVAGPPRRRRAWAPFPPCS